MTLKERVIIETYTGYCMTDSEERNEVYKYMEKLLGRPVFTHELGSKEIQEQLREKALPDFKTLCITEDKWEKVYKKVSDLLLLYLSFGSAGYFGVMTLNRLLERYRLGERTIELYEAMLETE